MNAGVVSKTFRDSRLILVLVPLAVVLFEVLVVRACSELPAEAAMWVERPFFKRLITMLLGAELTSSFTPTTLMTIGFAHPFMYAITWALLLTICTRVTVGEIDRGTADLLLTLPVTRASVYTSASLVWVLGGAAVSAAPLVGVWLGEWLHPLWQPIELARLRLLIVNLFALHLAVGCVTMFVSSLVSRRGTAIAIVLALLLASFVLNFLVTLWPAIEGVAAFGLLRYYRPLLAIRAGGLPIGDVLVLLVVSVVSWSAGLWRFSRRDIRAV